jgi:hypothetical protein
MKFRISGPAVAVAACLALAAPAGAATVNATVRVEGSNQTLLATTPVTLDSTKPVQISGKTCPGDTAAAALDQATKGNWDHQEFTQTILGETHKFDNNDYWAFWLDEKFSQQGICDQKLTNGDRMLMLVDVSGPPPDFASTVYPIAITGAPSSAATGGTATVSVVQYDANGNPAPLAGASIAGGGSPVTTGSDGRATVTFDHAGQIALKATKASERSDIASVCVHAGNDGTCGTSAGGSGSGSGGGSPGGSSSTSSPSTTSSPSAITDAVPPHARLLGIAEGRVYEHGQGPRLLKGTVGDDPSGLLMVKIRLTRNDGGKCASYSSKTERFKRTKCGVAHGWYFAIGNTADWSYLLPAKLGPGRYVLDVDAIDKAYNRDDARRRGDNRVVFTVQ